MKAKIIKIGIFRYYGFVDASYVELEPRSKKSQKVFVGAYRHSTEGIEYAKYCGIFREADLDKLIGKTVDVSFNIDDYGNPTIEISNPFDKTAVPFCSYYQIDEGDNWDLKFVTSSA